MQQTWAYFINKILIQPKNLLFKAQFLVHTKPNKFIFSDRRWPPSVVQPDVHPQACQRLVLHSARHLQGRPSQRRSLKTMLLTSQLKNSKKNNRFRVTDSAKSQGTSSKNLILKWWKETLTFKEVSIFLLFKNYK